MTQEPAVTTPVCPVCEYDLTGAVSERCPECGTLWRRPAQGEAGPLTGAGARLPAPGRRIFGLVAIAAGIATLLGALLVLKAPRPGFSKASLSLFDALALLALGLAAAGHVTLGIWASGGRGPWPIRNQELGRVLTLVACMSVLAGLIGAMPASRALARRGGLPEPREGMAEFTVYFLLFTVSGWLLLMLRLLAFRRAGGEIGTARQSAGSATVEPSAGAPFIIGFARRYTRAQLIANVSNVVRTTTPAIEQAISRAWEGEVAGAQDGGRKLYNGALARLVGIRADDHGLRLDLGATCYRDFLGTNLRNAAMVAAHDPSCLANALGTSALVMTSDGHLAFGKRGDRVIHHRGHVHSFGGIVEATDRGVDGTMDVFAAMLRELREELGIADEEVSNTVVCGLAYDTSILQPELLYEVSLTLGGKALRQRWETSPGRDEHVGLEFLHDDPESTAAFLMRVQPIAPVAQAAILLHGRYEWGADWYEQTCYLLYGALPQLLGNRGTV